MTRVLTVAVLVFLLDQLSKWTAVEALQLKTLGAIELFPPYLNLRMAWNQGVTFGLFSNDADVMRWALVAIAVGISLWLLGWARKLPQKSGQIFAGCVIGGAIGNAVDRLVYGAVADFLNMSCCGLNTPYAFNIADIAIFAGAFGLVLTTNKNDKNG